MNDLDYQNRTREFYSEIRSRQRSKEEPVPIYNKKGILSDNLKDTLKNWSEYYRNLYSLSGKSTDFRLTPFPDDHEYLDKDLSLTEFVDVIYTLKNYKSPVTIISSMKI